MLVSVLNRTGEPARTRRVGSHVRPSLCPSRSETRRELFAQRAAGLDEQCSVDRLVRPRSARETNGRGGRVQRRSYIHAGLHPLHLIVRQPARDARYLLRRDLLARLRAGVERRTTVVPRSTARKASFTASDVGNASATSGWSATNVVPLSRPAYLPRTPDPREAKSYSGRRSSGRRRLSFFIGAALTTRGRSG